MTDFGLPNVYDSLRELLDEKAPREVVSRVTHAVSMRARHKQTQP